MIIFNEVAYGEYLYSNNNNPSLKPKIYTIKELTILAKYLYHCLSKPLEDVKSELIQFCNCNYVGFDPDVNYLEINQALVSAQKAPPRDTQSNQITKSEFAALNTIEDERGKKILYVMLMIGKHNPLPQDGKIRSYLSKKELTKLANTRFRDPEEFFLQFKEYGEKKLLKVIPSKKIKAILYFGEPDPTPDSILYEFENTEDLMLAYEKVFNNAPIKKCKKCNHLFEDLSTNKNSIYCKECAVKPSLTTKKIESKYINKYKSRQEAHVENSLKQIVCQDCGLSFLVSKSNKRTTRCSSCQKIHDGKKSTILTHTCTGCGIQFEGSSRLRIKMCPDCRKKPTHTS